MKDIKNKNMNIVQLKEGLENGKITIDYKGHTVNSILRSLTWDVDHNQNFIKK